MKNLKFISLALVMISLNLFASNSIKVDFITKSIQPIPEIVIEVTTNFEKDLYQNFEIKFNDKSDIVFENFNKANIEPNVPKKQKDNNFQDQAARNYSYNLRSEIISKE